MRRALLGFMTLLMLTPVLVCTMAFCPMQSAKAASEHPCHETGGDDAIMFALDCMSVDLFLQDTSSDMQPDQSVDTIDYAWADLVSDYSIQLDNTNAIRAPPDGLEPPSAEFSIILTTQRFRI